MPRRVTLLPRLISRCPEKRALCASRRSEGKAAVFVVRGNVAREVPVEIKKEDGDRCEISARLKADDLLILHPAPELRDNAPVRAVPAKEKK